MDSLSNYYVVIATMDFEWLFGSDILEFMKSVENSDDEEIDSLLLAASESYERKPTACRPVCC